MQLLRNLHGAHAQVGHVAAAPTRRSAVPTGIQRMQVLKFTLSWVADETHSPVGPVGNASMLSHKMYEKMLHSCYGQQWMPTDILEVSAPLSRIDVIDVMSVN